MADQSQGGDGTNVVAILAIVILAGLAVLFLMYALPPLSSRNEPATPQPGVKLEIVPPETTPGPAPAPAPSPNPGN